ncbi:YdeI/OmpD-associated family protein [Desertivirga arenae]|uniref:YdeI/OmpD-associated family protein n=1 Tax=Desertivirga arenae TaxID=2810309 RepID=UPI001A9600CB|nr:YdeI/OmpD-associated family protein [Pedobacter sp. SYSU D00823]
MPHPTDPKIDAYIENAAGFAQPILKHIRGLIHKACPEIKETMKWGMPFFDYKGPVCNIAAFKQHCAFGFWKGALLDDPQDLLKVNADQAMGQFGRIASIENLPEDDIIMDYVRKAAHLNELDKKVSKKVLERTDIIVPEFLTEALNKNPLAKENFEKFSYSHRKEYVEWITEAKTETTRNKRLDTMIEWVSEGKSRNWKYSR